MNQHMYGEPTPSHMVSGHASPMLHSGIDGKNESFNPYHPSYANHNQPLWSSHQPSGLIDDDNMYGGPPGVPPLADHRSPMAHAGMGHVGPNGMLVTP